MKKLFLRAIVEVEMTDEEHAVILKNQGSRDITMRRSVACSAIGRSGRVVAIDILARRECAGADNPEDERYLNLMMENPRLPKEPEWKRILRGR